LPARTSSGWHLMKSLAVADRYGWTTLCGASGVLLLIGREYEWELMPLGLDQKVGALVWSPLVGRLTAKSAAASRCLKPAASTRRRFRPPSTQERLYAVVRCAGPRWPPRQVSRSQGPQLALAAAYRLPRSSSGRAMRSSCAQNSPPSAGTWTAARCHAGQGRAQPPIYPYWHQRQFNERNPLPV